MLTQGAFCKKDLHYSAGKMLILQSYEDTFMKFYINNTNATDLDTSSLSSKIFTYGYVKDNTYNKNVRILSEAIYKALQENIGNKKNLTI